MDDIHKEIDRLRAGGAKFRNDVVQGWHHRPREETQVLCKPCGPKTEMRMEPEDVAAALASTGFRLERSVELRPYHYGAIFTKT